MVVFASCSAPNICLSFIHSFHILYAIYSLNAAFFGVPIVGFFDQRHRKRSKPSATNSANGAVDEDQPLLPLQRTPQTKQHSYSVSFSDETASTVDSSSATTTAAAAAAAINDTTPTHRRSGKQLWGILQHHVRHESFHIRYQFKDTIRRQQDQIQFTDNVNLPYDFSVQDCALALCVYLIISIIAYSFVFENWTMIDSESSFDGIAHRAKLFISFSHRYLLFGILAPVSGM